MPGLLVDAYADAFGPTLILTAVFFAVAVFVFLLPAMLMPFVKTPQPEPTTDEKVVLSSIGTMIAVVMLLGFVGLGVWLYS